MSLYCLDGLLFRDNKIELSQDYSNNIDVSHPEQLFEIQHCDHIDIQNIDLTKDK